MPRRMKGPGFREEQRANRYAEHVAQINRFIDDLIKPERGLWAPHIAPYHGGRHARLLFLLRDPGPMTNDQDGRPGSGFLCVENNDPSAARFATLMAEAGVEPQETIGWNAYPWYINSAPTPSQREAGVEALAGLLRLLPELRVVMIMGRDAEKSWARLAHIHPDLAAGLQIVTARQPSPRAFISTVPGQKAAWKAEQLEAFRTAAAIVHGKAAKSWGTTESAVVNAFVAWLERGGWDVRTNVDHADVVATRDGERLVAEANPGYS